MKIIFPLISLAAFALLIVPAAVWRRKTGCKAVPIFTGMLTFFLFANILEGLLHSVFLLGSSATAIYLDTHPLAYMLYGGFAAGIFEETGRFIAFKTVLRRYDAPENAVAYGIGHGGFEVIIVVGLNYLLMTLAMRFPDMPEHILAGAALVLEQPLIAFAALWERTFALILHIALSVFVFRAAHTRSKLYLYPLAIVLHALVDFPPLLYQRGLVSLVMLELFFAEYAIVAALAAWRIYKNIKRERAEARQAETAAAGIDFDPLAEAYDFVFGAAEEASVSERDDTEADDLQ